MAAVLLFAVALLSSAPLFIQVFFFNAGAVDASDARYVVSAPFFGGFLLVGFYGLLYAIRHAGRIECLVGFLIVVFCYVAVEMLFQACGGN